MKSVASILAAPLACVALLGGIAVEKSTQIKPKDVGGFHAAAKASIDSIPDVIGSLDGRADHGGGNQKIGEDVLTLLRPNAILSRRYVYHWPEGRHPERPWPERVDLLVDQCPDARFMYGHYPKTCYPNSGQVLKGESTRDITAGDITLPVTEYQFDCRTTAGTYRQSVYNFLIVPNRGLFRNMDGVNAAAEDYQQRYYGAAQFQVLMSADLPQSERDEIFAEMMASCSQTIRLLAGSALPRRATPAGVSAVTTIKTINYLQTSNSTKTSTTTPPSALTSTGDIR